MAKVVEGDNVTWCWGNGTATGTVKSIFEERTTRKIDGTEVVRNGTKENPALYITQEDGGSVLKLLSEIETA
jgi:hypothetical protein